MSAAPTPVGRRRRTLTGVAAGGALLGALLAAPATVIAAPGDLDTGFGGTAAPLTAGLATAPNGGTLLAVAGQSDGKIVVVGTREGRMTVARLSATGQPDTSFGGGGSVSVGVDGSIARSVLVLPDGKILIGGDIRGGGLTAVRLNADGSPDGSFGTGGVATALTGGEARGSGGKLTVQPDGKVVAAGTAAAGAGTSRATVVRWTSQGALDPSFSGDGIAQVENFGTLASRALDVALQPDGQIVGVGAVVDTFGASASLAFRMTSAGSIDGSFGDGGAKAQGLALNGGGFSELRSVAVRSDGTIVAGGANTNFSGVDSLLTSFAPTGAPTTTTRVAASAPNASAKLNPPAGAFGLVSTPGHVYLGGAVEATGNFRLMRIGAYDPATGNANPGFGGRSTAPFGSGLAYAPSPGHTYVGGDERAGGSVYSGRQAQITGIARLADGRIAAVGNVGAGIGSSGIDSGDGVVGVFEGLPEPATPADPGPGTPTNPQGPGTSPRDPVKQPAKLAITRATVVQSSRRLSVRAPITARASGEVAVTFRASGRLARYTAKVDAKNRRVSLDRKITRAQARLGTGIVTLNYPGDADTQRQEVRLRAATRRADLDAGRPKLEGGRLTASGTISKRARGIVRLQVFYDVPGTTEAKQLKLTARISNGRYRFNEKLPDSVAKAIAERRGVVHSYTLFTGYLRERMRGEMASYQVLDKP